MTDNRTSIWYFLKFKAWYCLCFFFTLIPLMLGLDNGLALTPPMGWNSWNYFRCNITEKDVKDTVHLLISTGLADKGYKYVNIDDCWQKSRDPFTNKIVEDRRAFPSGMPALSQFIHEKGLLFGLYSSGGDKTCEKRPGSLGFEGQDANTYDQWKVDYLKYDNCYNHNISSKIRYPAMAAALKATGRSIIYSMCQWGEEKSFQWAHEVANSWRTTPDIEDNWPSIIRILDLQVGLSKYSKKGAWNDPDMLEVGNGGMYNDEYQSHFVLWAALKAPLIIGCNLNTVSKETLTILGNEEVIAINQDPLGKQADLIFSEESNEGDFKKQIWGGPLSQNRYVIIFFNRGDRWTDFTINLNSFFSGKKVRNIRDVINHEFVNLAENEFLSIKQVRRHAVAAVVVTFKD